MRKTISIDCVVAGIERIAVDTNVVYVYTLPGRQRRTIHSVPQQGPMRAIEKLEQARCLPRRPRIGASGARPPETIAAAGNIELKSKLVYGRGI